VRAFRKKAGIKSFLFGQDLTHGLGTGLNTDLAKAAAESEKDRIAKLFEGQDIVMLISCLGGGLGSGATKVFAEAVENFQGIIFGIFTLPFKFEGKNKQRLAYKALKELRKSLNVSITIPNERIFKIIDENTAITDAFSMVNKNLIESLESLIDLISSPGIINIDFADLRAILRGKGNIAFLNTAEAQGKDSAQKVAEQILQNPLYQNSNFTAEKILFNILGGAQLSMFDVDKISRAIALQNPKAKIIFGISKDAKFKNKIKTTLLMTGQGQATEVAPKKAPVKKPVAVVKVKKPAPVLKKIKKPAMKKKVVKKAEENLPVILPELLPPVFGDIPVAAADSRKLSIIESPEIEKRAIRRSALEIKEAEEVEENKKSKQEEEWDIPAFLRKVNRN
jgi:cell division protein FtsZ